jgi:hypothetical protein
VAIAFPVDRDRWYSGSRYVKTASPNQDGRFTLPAMPPGDYWIAALDAQPDAAFQDVEVLTELSTIARRVTVDAGQKLAIDVLLARMPR